MNIDKTMNTCKNLSSVHVRVYTCRYTMRVYVIKNGTPKIKSIQFNFPILDRVYVIFVNSPNLVVFF